MHTPTTPRILSRSIAALLGPVLAILPQQAAAADIYWDRGAATNAWGTVANWSTAAGAATPDPAAIPGAADVAIFNISTLNTAQTIDMGADRPVLGLGFVSTGTVLLQGGGTNRTLTIGASGITKSGTGAITIGSTTANQNVNVRLSADQTWVNNNNTGTINIVNSVTASSAVARTLTLGGTSTAGNIVNGVISNNGAGVFSLSKANAGLWILSAANTFTGPVNITGGTLRIQNSAGLGAGTVVNLGTGSTLDVRNTITVAAGKTLTMNSNSAGDLRSTLLNGANNNNWNSNIVASGTGLVQINSASGTLTINGTVTSAGGGGTGTLFSRGAGVVVYNGLINLGTDRIFNKTDAGTVIVNSTGNSWVRTQSADGQIQIGANDALANVEFTLGQASGTNGRLELNGFSQSVTRLNSWSTSTGTNHIIRNSNLTSASTLTFSTPLATTDTLTNVNVFGTANGLGTLNLVSNGAGRTEFNNGLVSANSWTVNSGTLAFIGTANRLLPGSVSGAVGATIDKAGTGTLGVTGTFDNAGATTVSGGTLALSNGTTGDITVADGATLSTGLNGGTISASSLTFGTAGATVFAPIVSTPAAAAGISPTTLTITGTPVTVVPQAGAFTTGIYKLIDYGTIGGSGFAGFALGPVGSYPHITATLLDNGVDGRLDLDVTAVDSLTWAGNLSGVWDVNSTSNFALASSPTTTAPFYSGDAVVFGDTEEVTGPATPVANRTITGSAVNIGNLTFNNSTGNYSVANALSGVGSITKNGTSTTTLSGANTYVGTTTVTDGVLVLSGANTLAGVVNVTGGTLRIGNADALRGTPLVTVSAGATFDANGTAVGARYAELVVSGTGVGGNGAIVNNGAAITNNSHFATYTLAGDTTWGGTGRYDIVASQIFNGGAFTLTKVGTGEMWYNPAAGSTLENVIVNGGAFGSQGANPLSATATVTVNATGTHQIFSSVAQQHMVVLNDGGTLRSNSGTPTLNGTVTLNGTDTNRFIGATSGTQLNIEGKVTGTGGFTKNDAGTVQLQNASNDYAGDTAIAAGTLRFNAVGVLPTTTNLIFSGGTLDPANRTHNVASISGASGSINQGTAGTGRVVTNQSTTTVFDGTVNRVTVAMNGTGSLTLGGTADNAAGIAEVNSGTVIFAKGNGAPVAQAIHAVGGGATVNAGTLQLSGVYDNITTPGTGVNLAPVGIDPATYVDQIYNAVTLNLNAGTFDLNGRQEAINGLANPAGAGGTVTNSAVAAAKLFVGHQNAGTTFAGAINDGTGTVAIEKIGTGVLTLSGTSNFTGGLTLTAGTVNIPTGAVLGNTPITSNANSILALDGTLGNGAIAINGTSSLVGAGTSGGILTAASGTTLRVGAATAGTTATMLTLGGLDLSGGANLNLDFNTASTTVDKIATTVTNGVTLNGANNVNIVLSGNGWVTGTYPVISYSGAVGGTGAAALTLSTPIGHNTIGFVDDAAGNINLSVVATANKWVGGNGTPWDTATTLNWNAGDQLFLAGDTVIFDDTATTFTADIAANQTPTGVTFNNTVANPYALTSTGAFGIAGTAGLIKKNTGSVTISSANTYTGVTDVQEGTLIANYNTGTAKTVFAAASIINVAPGATFQAVANDSNFTLANALTGSGTVVIDPHLTAAAAVREVVISGNNTGFTGTLRLSPTTDVASGLGTFRTNAVLTPTTAGGATIDVDNGAQAWINASTFANNFIISGMGFAETAGGTPVVASGLTQYSGAVKGGIGAIRMDANAVISGTVTLDGTAKIMPYNTTGTISGSISVTNPTDVLVVGGGGAGTTLILTGTNDIGANALNDVFVNSGGTAGTNVLAIGANGTVGTLGTGTVSLNGDAAIGAVRFDRADGYTLAAGNTITSSGSNTGNTRLFIDTQGTGFQQNGVAINLGGGALQFGTIAGRVGATGSFDGSVTLGSINVGTAATGAVMNILPGANIVNTGNFFLGEQSGFSGTVNQTGGASTAGTHMRIGHWPTETSAYNISAGTLAITANPALATDPSNTGESNGGIYVGVDGGGILNQSATSTVTTDWVVLDNRGDTAGVDQYNLSGGILEIRGQYGIANRNGTTEFNFTGGTIKNVGAAVNARIAGAGTFNIGTGGDGIPTIDTNGASNAFTASRGFSGVGDLIKAGDGTLNLNAASAAWTGNLTVNGGIVATSGINGGLGSFTTPGRTITLNNASTVSMTTNNVFGNGVGNPDLPTLIVNAGSTVSSTRYNALGPVELNAGTLTQSATDGPGAYEGYQFLGNVSVVGSALSTISTGNGRANHLAANTTFTVADVTGDTLADLVVSAPLKDQSGDFASAAGGLTKAGAGTMELSGANTYTGLTTISAGTLALSGGAAIADTAAVSIANVAGATLQLNASETIASLSGGGAIGGTVALDAHTLTIGDATPTAVFSGAITGATGTLIKQGAGTVTLDGLQSYGTLTTTAGTTNLDSSFTGGTATINANAATNISANQTLAALNIGAGAVVTLDDAAPAPAFLAGADAFAPAGDIIVESATQVVPEPGSAALLLGGLTALLGLRRRKA